MEQHQSEVPAPIPKQRVFERARALNLSPSDERLERFRDAKLLDDFAELPKNGASMATINLDQSVGWGANVQWDGKYVTVPDVNASKIYRFTISGNSGTLKGTVDLESAESFYETWIDGNKVVGADILSNTVWYWNYPAGGSAIKSITKDILAPYGVTISKAPN